MQRLILGRALLLGPSTGSLRGAGITSASLRGGRAAAFDELPEVAERLRRRARLAPVQCTASCFGKLRPTSVWPFSRGTPASRFPSGRLLQGPDVEFPGIRSTASGTHPLRSSSLWPALGSEPPAALSSSRGASPRRETARLRSAQGGGDGELPWHWRWRPAVCRIEWFAFRELACTTF